MDGLAPSPRRSDRPMVSQNTGPGNDGRRRGPGGFGPLEPTDDGNLSLGRRIGVLVVLAALGGAIILAAGGVGGNKSVAPLVSPSAHTSGVGRTPRPLPSPPTVAPRISTPKVPLISTRTITLRVTVPEPGTSMSGLELHVYRNSKLLASQKVTGVGRLKVTNVPLRRGANKLTATIANGGGEGPRSAIVTITLDDQPPKVSVKSPRTNTTLNQSHVTITGRTEDGLSVSARNLTSDARETADADASGAYSLDLGLAPGRNVITVSSRDAAGNRGSASLVVIRGDGRLAANLELSHRKFRLKSLPRTMNARVTVLDVNGRPVDGATVVFSIAAPGQLTYNHASTTQGDGTARWSGIQLTKSKAIAGDGFVAVQVTTPDGGSVKSTVHFQYK
jgi:Glucodextranase, domain B